MIAFWNRKEVFCGFSMQDFDKALDILSENRIKYAYRIVNYASSRNNIIGQSGESSNCSAMYYIYVHKKDAARADLF